jgi:signal peptidase I
MIALALTATALVLQSPDVFRTASENMIPAIGYNARIRVDRHAFDERSPRVGDLVLIRPSRAAIAENGPRCGRPRAPAEDELCVRAALPTATEVRFVERVVAGPGDRVAFRRGRVIRNGVVEQRKLRACGQGSGCTFRGTITVPRGHFYVAGDNRGQSDDSRFWGAVPRRNVVAKVVEVLDPVDG